MNKLMRIFSVCAVFPFLLSVSSAYADTGSATGKWDLSYTYEESNINSAEAEANDDKISFSSVRAGYIHSNRLQFGFLLGQSREVNLKGGNIISWKYRHTYLGPDVQFNAYSKSIGNSTEVTLYARGYVKYLVAESEIEWRYGIYTVRETSKAHLFAPGYSIGVDFLFGKKKNLYAGLEYTREAGKYAGEKKLAKFDTVNSMIGLRIGLLIGKQSAVEEKKEEENFPLMNTINGLSESEWHSVMGGRSELDLGNYRPSGNFGGYGNAWFGN